MPSFDEVVGVMLDTCGLVMRLGGYRGACRRQNGHDGLHVAPVSNHVLLVSDYSGSIGDMAWRTSNPVVGALMVRQDIPSPELRCFGLVTLPNVLPLVADGKPRLRLQQKFGTATTRCCLSRGHGDLCIGKIEISSGNRDVTVMFPNIDGVPSQYLSRVVDSNGHGLLLLAATVEPIVGPT